MKSRRRPPSGEGLILALVVVALIGIGLAALFGALRPAARQVPLKPAGASPAAHAGSAGSRQPSADPGRSSRAHGASQRPLAGKVVGIDPGHNGGNVADPAYINKPIWNGRFSEPCDTTGTSTDGGYTEARYNFNVAQFLRADLLKAGARVVMTRTTNTGVGPCVNRRAKILNNAHANVAIDIHADGGPPSGRGFSVLEPVTDGPNDKVIGSSARFGRDVLLAMTRHTPMPVSNYYGHNGIQPRDDLAGLNLNTEPKVLIECGNMRNAADARLLTSTAFQKQVAAALMDAIITFLTGH